MVGGGSELEARRLAVAAAAHMQAQYTPTLALLASTLEAATSSAHLRTLPLRRARLRAARRTQKSGISTLTTLRRRCSGPSFAAPGLS